MEELPKCQRWADMATQQSFSEDSPPRMKELVDPRNPSDLCSEEHSKAELY